MSQSRGQKTTNKYAADLADFINEYQDEGLFKYHSKREHIKGILKFQRFPLLLDTQGFLSPSVSFNLMWNRVANFTGRAEGNLELVNELMNNNFKGIRFQVLVTLLLLLLVQYNYIYS